MAKLKLKKVRRRPIGTRVLEPLGNLHTHFQVLIDCNEGHRVTFPPTMRWSPRFNRSCLITIGTKGVNLGRNENSRGDYALEGYTHVTAIERKGKMSELERDLKTGKLDRQLRVLKELVKFPYLLLDFPLPEMYGTGRNAEFDEENPTPATLDKVLLLLNRHGVPHLGPYSARGSNTRRYLGEWMIRVMLSHIHGEKYVLYDSIRVKETRKRKPRRF